MFIYDYQNYTEMRTKQSFSKKFIFDFKIPFTCFLPITKRKYS